MTVVNVERYSVTVEWCEGGTPKGKEVSEGCSRPVPSPGAPTPLGPGGISPGGLRLVRGGPALLPRGAPCSPSFSRNESNALDVLR